MEIAPRDSKSQLHINLILHDEPFQMELVYDLFETPVVHRWLDMLQQDLAATKPIWMDGVCYGSVFSQNDLVHLNKEINQCLLELDVPRGTLFSRLVQDSHDHLSLDRIHDLRVELMHLACALDFSLPGSMLRQLDRLNFLVHRIEFSDVRFANQGSLVVVPFLPSRMEFHPEDYFEFTPDTHYGYLYLDYGTDGVTVLDCFRTGGHQKPTPQRNISSGFCLSFWNDWKFPKMEELNTWLKQYHPEWHDNPASAIGQVPLGRLAAQSEPREQLISKLKLFSKVQSVSLRRIPFF